MGLRCRMVTFFYLRFTFFFEHFLQGTMDLRHGLITSLQRHLTNSLQTACEHLTIFTSPPPRIRRGRNGGGYGVTYLLRTFDLPQNVSPCVLVLVPRGGPSRPPRFFPEGVKAVAYILCTSSLLTPHETGGDNINQPEDWPNTELGF